MVLPNFLIVGAAKAGTTSLYNYLASHPQVYMSPDKEPRYFAPEYYTEYCRHSIGNTYRAGGMTLSEYEQLFSGMTDEIAIGEASTEYLFFPKSAQRIKKTIPEAKILIILRNPVERAFSAYCYHLRDGREQLPFDEALNQESLRQKEKWQVGWFYQQGGFYYEQVKRYYQTFPLDNIKIILWEHLNQDSQTVCSDIFHFLKVNTDFTPSLSRANKSAIPRSKTLNRYVFKNRKLKKWAGKYFSKEIYTSISNPLKQFFYVDKSALTGETKDRLKKLYYDDILRLEELTSIDFSYWKNS